VELNLTIAKTLQDLHLRKANLDRTIAALEQLHGTSWPLVRRKRGRKSMGEGERKEVSQRMKRYWEGRRAQPQIAKSVA